MNHLTIQNLSKRYGEKLLFEGLDISINEGEKVALIAKNGKGKSTIFRILNGTEDYDAGSFRFAPGLRVSFLEQRPHFEEDKTILETVLFADNDMVKAILYYEKALAAGDPKLIDKGLSRMDANDAWNYELKVKKILDEVGIKDIHQKVGSLSGGEQKRVALARIFIEEPEMLLLDEPTNHLDLELIEWLENMLIQMKATLLMVTHDRYFLENICDKIIEIDDQRTFIYPGNYSQYLELKATRQEIEARTIGKAKSLMKTELEWIRRMPKARGTKNKARIESFYEIKAIASKNVGEDEFKLLIEPKRLGGKIIDLHHIHKSYGNRKLIDDFSYKFKRFEKVGIIGPNGSGKSTLLNIMTGQLKPDAGKVNIGETVHFGYYHQSGMNFGDDQLVIDVVRDIAEYIPLKGGKKLTAGQLCEMFLFDRKQQFHLVSTLSGGERRRLYLLTILMQNPNFLILDEPTNDLDIFTLNILEDFLLDLQVNLIIVSHDRFFMDKLVDHLFVLKENGKVDDFPGNYSTYRAGEGTFFDLKEAKPKPVEKVNEKASENKISYEDRKLLKKLESSIANWEQKRADLEAELLTLSDDYEKIMAKQKEIDEATARLEEKEMEWLELSEKLS
ncbi:MAG: ABC-F family ATP-binding cassette domain-containing protein [Chitinophagales bacterium]